MPQLFETCLSTFFDTCSRIWTIMRSKQLVNCQGWYLLMTAHIECWMLSTADKVPSSVDSIVCYLLKIAIRFIFYNSKTFVRIWKLRRLFYTIISNYRKYRIILQTLWQFIKICFLLLYVFLCSISFKGILFCFVYFTELCVWLRSNIISNFWNYTNEMFRWRNRPRKSWIWFHLLRIYGN